jgi:DNA-binding NarL/FixJ family response regulator
MNEPYTSDGRLGAKTSVLPVNAPKPDLQGEQIPAMGIGWPRILTVGRAEACAAFMRAVHGTLPFHAEITAMPNPAAAPMHLARRHYDLVALLLPLPEGDAARACRDVRAVSRQVHILVLDPNGTVDQALAVYTAGANTYLSGQVQPDELGACLAALLPPQRWVLAYNWRVSKMGR